MAPLPRPYDRTTYDGRIVDWLTRVALEAVAGILGYPLTLLQGSYSTAVDASGNTHAGGGAVDLDPTDHKAKVRALRKVGFAAWFRPELWIGGRRIWGAHIHAVLIGNRRLSPAARAQVAEYLAGYDGLAGDHLDTGPRQYVDNRFRWRTGAHRINAAAALIARARAKLAAGIRGYRVQPALRALHRAAGVLEEAQK